ncbi:MAG: 3'-5' exonuclease [Sphingomonadales bacterium]|nr:3'-5' exonuclease [Sphingomonadales bacterium]
MLQLTRPLAFIDLETTGLNISSDRIVEISVLKAMPDGTTQSLTQRIHPGIPIPPEVTKIHGISDADVASQPSFREFAPRLMAFMQNCDFAGYNSGYFDLPMLAEELMRTGHDFDWSDIRMVDVQTIFHKNEPRDLKAAYRFYCDKDMEGAHSAEADIQATYEVLLGQLNRYPELKGDVDFLHRYTIRNNQSVDLAGRIVRDAQGREVFSFGKYKGQPVADVFARDNGYYQWMMDGDFPAYTKKIITRIRLNALDAS